MDIRFKILALGMIVAPMLATAQNNIKKSFDKLVNNSSVTVTQNHSLEKNPETGAKVSQYDIYRFSMPANKAALVKDVEKAFNQDADKAYSMTSGVRSYHEPTIAIAVGEGNGTGVIIAKRQGSSYIYACFLDPEDADKNHRYAYAVDYITVGDSITGTLAVTYGTTLKYRQQNPYFFGFPSMGQTQVNYQDQDGGQSVTYDMPSFDEFMNMFYPEVANARAQQSQPSWFALLMNYITSMDINDIATQRAIATRIYELAKTVGEYEVSIQDKNTAYEIIVNLANESNDQVVKSLLNSSLSYLK